MAYYDRSSYVGARIVLIFCQVWTTTETHSAGKIELSVNNNETARNLDRMKKSLTAKYRNEQRNNQTEWNVQALHAKRVDVIPPWAGPHRKTEHTLLKKILTAKIQTEEFSWETSEVGAGVITTETRRDEKNSRVNSTDASFTPSSFPLKLFLRFLLNRKFWVRA